MARRRFAFRAMRLGSVILIGAIGFQASAQTASAKSKPQFTDIKLERERAAIREFQQKDQLLQDIGWKMVLGNAAFCDDVVPSIGLQLQDAASYGRPDIARAALRLDGDFAVQTAAAGSPAEMSGAFARNREVTAIAARDPNRWQAGDRMYWQRLTRLHDFIDETLKAERTIAVRFEDGALEEVTAVDVCDTRFELVAGDEDAAATGERVVIGAQFTGFTYPENVFAGAIAHELAHNVLGHRAWLDRNGRKRRKVRLTEREADRLMPWLMANAGYDPWDAHLFMVRWGKANDGGLFRKRTHDGWDERAEFIAAEIPEIERLLKAEGKADWSVHFRREIDPQLGLNVARRD